MNKPFPHAMGEMISPLFSTRMVLAFKYPKKVDMPLKQRNYILDLLVRLWKLLPFQIRVGLGIMAKLGRFYSPQTWIAQFDLEYTDFIFAEGVASPPPPPSTTISILYMTSNNLMVKLLSWRFGEYWIHLHCPSSQVVAPDMVLSMGQIESLTLKLFAKYDMLNWIVQNKTLII